MGRVTNRGFRRRQLKRIYKRDGGICQLCKTPCERTDASREHVKAVALGGRPGDNNVVLAHKKCNEEAGKLVELELKLRKYYFHLTK